MISPEIINGTPRIVSRPKCPCGQHDALVLYENDFVCGHCYVRKKKERKIIDEEAILLEAARIISERKHGSTTLPTL